jgi:tRNA-dihydrouridine synthase A
MHYFLLNYGVVFLLQIAPMVDWTNSPFRLMMRLLLPQAKLFTEMIVPQAIIRNASRYLSYYSIENPLVLQLGGSDVNDLLQASKIAQDMGYQEINLNLGCPSERVQAGQFGACLMTQKPLVMQCLSHLKNNLDIPVTAKTRIGVDEHDSYAFFEDYVDGLVETGIDELVVHARKAWLKGLNPKQNRTIPPIQYEYVYRIKEKYPNLSIIINGDLKTLEQMQTQLDYVDGVMLGRLACDNPMLIQAFHQRIYPNIQLLTREQAIHEYFSIIEKENFEKHSLSIYLKPLFNLYHGTIDAKRWRQVLQNAIQSKSMTSILENWQRKI